ncbi:MAG: glycosyltransferase family 4 protein [Methanomassiliicoccales archaeon]
MCKPSLNLRIYECHYLYNNATILVIPSLLEGFCMPGLEAMTCGCALVTTDNKGVHEYARNDENCKIVPIKDPAAIRDACIYLLKNKEERIRIANNGIKTASGFDFDRMYREFKMALGLS